MSAQSSFYVTTPIYYVNDEPHIGHAYTTVLADVISRFHRLSGQETFFLTGTDEHGQKVLTAARARGVDPQEHCDEMVQRFQRLWERLEIRNDDFIRTTEERHERVVLDFVRRIDAAGDIYDATYEGWYCIPDERFWTEKDLLAGGNCPLCERPTTKLTERNYFFRMSRYQDWLIEHIRSNPEFLQPESRRNEILGFLRKPLGDLCITRPKSRLGWGVPFPLDEEYVIYVWLDALVNYYSAVVDRKRPDGSPWWPADLHLIGKDILTTHAVYWPTMLKSAGLPIPRTILAHGWWLVEETKMSKSLGNVVKPISMADRYGHDAFRYFLMRDMVLGQDAGFSEESLVGRINSDLANDLGNCLNRVERMIDKHCARTVPEPGASGAEEQELERIGRRTAEAVPALIGELKLHAAIEETLQMVRATNRYLEVKAPWKAVKEGGTAAVASTLWFSTEAIRLAASLLSPVMPAKCGEALHRLGVLEDPAELVSRPLRADQIGWGLLEPGTEIRPGAPLFPRIEQT
ncbi:MAG: methionine--tRNA ligase [Candidatus Eisenbacteria bacterium]|nr:methionine--tRNA ligase [Candidatus Latescibacterota bacterium]MBD3303297.1 methionine--tRNA ligase [Candidatus Eisenbacteria bacterium]